MRRPLAFTRKHRTTVHAVIGQHGNSNRNCSFEATCLDCGWRYRRSWSDTAAKKAALTHSKTAGDVAKRTAGL